MDVRSPNKQVPKRPEPYLKEYPLESRLHQPAAYVSHRGESTSSSDGGSFESSDEGQQQRDEPEVPHTVHVQFSAH